MIKAFLVIAAIGIIGILCFAALAVYAILDSLNI